jgi:hypothetical protein
MATTTIGAYTYTTTGSNNIIVSGPGMPRVGGDLGNLSNLSGTAFLQLASSPNLSPEAQEAMRAIANTGEWTQIKAGLAPTAPNNENNADGKTSSEQSGPAVGAQNNETESQNSQYLAQGGAQDDNPAPNQTGVNAATTGATNADGSVNTSGTTNDGVNTSGATNAKDNSPNRRTFNPLSKFASYTYNISLYMITPEAYDAFILSGRRNIYALNSGNNTGPNQAAGVYIIAQSGGINATENRAPGFKFDYYIDDLVIKTATNAKNTGSSTNTTTIKFKIYEPYGFSFVTNLKKTQDALQKYMESTGRSQKGLKNPLRQFYVLGLRFTGYDQSGNVVVGKDAGKTIDQNASERGVFENFYDIAITSMKFKISGPMVTYDIEAAPISTKEGFGKKRGLIDLGANFEAGTAKEAIENLIAKLNKDQQDLVGKGIGKPDVYKIDYIGDMSDRLTKASIINPADLDKYRWGSSGAKTVEEVSDIRGEKIPPNSQKRQLTFQGTTPILQAINQIISQSSYLLDALKVVYTNNTEPNSDENTDEEEIPGGDKNVRWYNLSATISKAEWDEVRSDFALNITYVISPYETPVLQNAYTNPGIKYYGPHKRYEYWYTGQNSEIISYEQVLNTAYFNVALKPNVSGDGGKGGNADIPLKANQRTSQPRIGELNEGMEAQNSYLTNLFDPGSYAEAKMTILGDPDFLIYDSEATSSVQTVYDKFYGTNRFTIKANGGQVFIEVDFKEAIDYNNEKGIMDINQKILFWDYPEDIAKVVKGVSYMVLFVQSNFTKGKFTQNLDLTINTFPDNKKTGKQTTSQARVREVDNSIEQGGTSKGGSSTTGTAGLLPDPRAESWNNDGPGEIGTPGKVQIQPVQLSNDDDQGGSILGKPGY